MENFKDKSRVIYIPKHAKGDRLHKDCKWGTVSSSNESVVFVKFDEQVSHLGWDGTTSQGCYRHNLELGDV